MYTWTSISVQTRGSRERWFGNNSLLGGFWGIRVTWLGFHSNSPHIFGTASAAVERVFSFFGKEFDDQNLANAQIKGGLHLKPPCCCTTHCTIVRHLTCCIFILIDYFCLRTKGSVKCIHILCTGLCIHTEIAFVKLFFCFLCAAKLVRHLFFEFEVEHNSSIMGQGWSIIGENFCIKRIFSESIIGEHLEHKRRFLKCSSVHASSSAPPSIWPALAPTLEQAI
jgi:hypothetical protein